MAALREHAEYLRLALAMGLLDIPDVVAWADACIAACENAPIELIDVSLGGTRPRREMITLLGKIEGSADYTAAAHRALGLLRHLFVSADVSLNFAVEALQAYYNWARVSEQEREDAYMFDDLLYCAKQGYTGSLDSVRSELLAFLDRFAQDPELGLTNGCS